MKYIKKYFILAVLAFGMLLICAVTIVNNSINSKVSFDMISFYDREYQLEIDPFYDKTAGKYYLFLPSYTNKGKISLQHNNRISVSFHSGETDYERFDELPLLTDIVVTVEGATGNDVVTMQVLQCKNIPTIYIETESGAMDFVELNKQNKEETAVFIINPDGSMEHFGMAEISGAGNTTSVQAKRPYNLKFEKPADLFGIAEVRNWRLMANYADDSMLRNYICYNTAANIGIPYTSRMEFVSLFLNGQYNGVYNLCTKNKYENDIDNVLAVFEKSDYDREYDYVSVQNTQNTYISFCYGNTELIKSTVDAFNTALYSSLSYEQIISCVDIVSFAKKYLIDEILADCDDRLSQYFAINTEGKITAICAWDYDLTLGIAWKAYFDTPYNSSVLSNSWHKALWIYPEFRQLVLSLAKEYESLFIDGISRDMLHSHKFLENDWALNNLRWRGAEPFWSGRTKLKCQPELTTLSSHIAYIENFLSKRFDFFIDYWTNPESFYSISFVHNGKTVRAFYSHNQPLTNDTLPGGVLTMYEDTEKFLGWHTEDGLSLFDVDSVTENLAFYAAWKTDGGGDEASANSVTPQTYSESFIIKLIKWPVRNLGLENTAAITAFGMTFLFIMVVNIRISSRQKAEKMSIQNFDTSTKT